MYEYERRKAMMLNFGSKKEAYSISFTPAMISKIDYMVGVVGGSRSGVLEIAFIRLFDSYVLKRQHDQNAAIASLCEAHEQYEDLGGALPNIDDDDEFTI